MKNKKLFGLTALCCTSMLLFACNNNNKKPTPHGPTLYTVTFYSEGEIFDIRQAEAGDVVDAPANDPVKLNHDFLGWYTEQEAGVKWVFETDVVNDDMNLYAHFEASQIDYTVNLLLGDNVAATKTTNSHDQNDVTLTQISVGDGKSLLGYGVDAGTTANDVDYRVGATLTYEQVVALANDQHVVNLHAIVKTGEILRLNVALWERYADEACMERVLAAFKTKADTSSIDYDFLDYTVFQGDSGEQYNRVADFAAGVAQDVSLGVAFPTGSNFSTQTDISSAVKDHVALGIAIENAKGETASDTSRYVTRLSDNALDVAFFNWLVSDEGKVVLNSEYEPSTEHGEASATKLVFGVWGRFFSQELATGLVNATKTYLTAQGITYDDVEAVYYDSTDYNGKAAYLGAAKDDLSLDILLPVSKAIAKGTDSDIPATFQPKFGTTLNLGETDGDDVGLGLTIGGQTNRWLVALNNDAITNAFITFCSTEDGMKALDPTHGEDDPEVVQTTLTVSFYGKFITSDAADLIMDALEDYFTAQGLTFTTLTPDYVSGESGIGNNNTNYLSHMSANADVSIGGKTNLTGFAKDVVKTVNIGDVKDANGTLQSDRACFTFVNGNLCNACADFFATTTWTTLLAQINA